MPFPIERKLVIAVASSALFDLRESDRVFREQGLENYREFLRQHQDDILPRGVAFPFVRRLLSLNRLDDERPMSQFQNPLFARLPSRFPLELAFSCLSFQGF
jgi:5'-nucleotidase